MVEQRVQIVGALLVLAGFLVLGALDILVPFALFQLGRVSQHGYAYLGLNTARLADPHPQTFAVLPDVAPSELVVA